MKVKLRDNKHWIDNSSISTVNSLGLIVKGRKTFELATTYSGKESSLSERMPSNNESKISN